MWAVVVGVLAGCLVGGALSLSPNLYAADFTGAWRSAGLLLRHVDPYGIDTRGSAYPLGPLAYPLPAAIVALPLASLPAWLAAGVFVAVGAAALAYGVLEGPGYRLLVLGSPCFVMAISLAQWSPLLTAAGMLAPLGAFAICKPNLGLALFARRPTWWIAGGGLLLLVVSLALVPSWPMEWRRVVSGMSYYQAPVTVMGGPLLLLALLRWRDPDARLLLAMSLVPSNLILYDQLPLFLIARNKREMLVLFAGSWIVPIVTRFIVPEWVHDDVVSQTYMRAPVVAFLFLPALYLVLSRRKDTGAADGVDRVLNAPIAWRRAT